MLSPSACTPVKVSYHRRSFLSPKQTPHFFNCLTGGLTLRLQGPWGTTWYMSLSPLPCHHPATYFRVAIYTSKSFPGATHHCHLESPCTHHLESLTRHLSFGMWGPPLCAPRSHAPRTYHLLEQWWVAFSKEHTEVQDLRDVKQEVIVEDFSKCRGGNEVILRNGAEKRWDFLKADALSSKSELTRNNLRVHQQGTG